MYDYQDSVFPIIMDPKLEALLIYPCDEEQSCFSRISPTIFKFNVVESAPTAADGSIRRVSKWLRFKWNTKASSMSMAYEPQIFRLTVTLINTPLRVYQFEEILSNVIAIKDY